MGIPQNIGFGVIYGFEYSLGDLFRRGQLSQQDPCGPMLCLSLLPGFVAHSLSQLLVGSAVLNEMGVDCASSKCVFLRCYFCFESPKT